MFCCFGKSKNLKPVKRIIKKEKTSNYNSQQISTQVIRQEAEIPNFTLTENQKKEKKKKHKSRRNKKPKESEQIPPLVVTESKNESIRRNIECYKDFEEEVKKSKRIRRQKSLQAKEPTLDQLQERDVRINAEVGNKRDTELDFEIEIRFSSEERRSIRIPSQFNCIGKVNFPIEKEVRVKNCEDMDLIDNNENFCAKSEIVFSVKSIELEDNEMNDENVAVEKHVDQVNGLNCCRRNIGYYLDDQENKSISDTSFTSEVSQVPLFSSRKTIDELNCSETGDGYLSFNQIFTPELEQYSTSFPGRENLGTPFRSTGVGNDKDQMMVPCSTDDHSECKSNYSNVSQYHFPVNPMRSIYENLEIYEEIRKHLGDSKPNHQKQKQAIPAHRRQMYMITEKINEKKVEINTVEYHIKKLNKRISHMISKAENLAKLLKETNNENNDLENEIFSISRSKLLMQRFN